MMKLILKLGIGSMVFLLFVGYVTRLRSGGGGPADRTEAINNAKQIGLALIDFDDEYGHFPDASTATLVKAKSKTSLTLGTGSSNQLFRQLLCVSAKSEKMFYSRMAHSRKPDDLFADDAHALAPGECGFAYISGLSSSGDPATPVLVSPMIPGTTRFDPGPFQGKAVALFLDNSAKALPIDKSGHAILNGMDLFDPRQPFWKGKAPDIKWPE